MSKLKVDNLSVFFILISSHKIEGVDESMRKDITIEKLMLR